MKRSLQKLSLFFDIISRENDPFIIAVDGPGGSGKSFFVDHIDDYDVVHFDDFYLPVSDPEIIGSNFDWQRLQTEVLLPYKRNKKCNYQIYNWITNSLDSRKKITGKKYLFIEDVTSGRLELRDYLNFIIFVDAPGEITLKRGIERDGEKIRDQWLNDWHPRENNYFESSLHRTKLISDLVIDGTYFNNDEIKIIYETNNSAC
jgi:uridine kinase